MQIKEKSIVGKVLKVNNVKTRLVEFSFYKKNNVFGKPVLRTRKYLAHDEENLSEEGDIVSLVSVRPISARKSWLILRKL